MSGGFNIGDLVKAKVEQGTARGEKKVMTLGIYIGYEREGDRHVIKNVLPLKTTDAPYEFDCNSSEIYKADWKDVLTLYTMRNMYLLGGMARSNHIVTAGVYEGVINSGRIDATDYQHPTAIRDAVRELTPGAPARDLLSPGLVAPGDIGTQPPVLVPISASSRRAGPSTVFAFPVTDENTTQPPPEPIAAAAEPAAVAQTPESQVGVSRLELGRGMSTVSRRPRRNLGGGKNKVIRKSKRKKRKKSTRR